MCKIKINKILSCIITLSLLIPSIAHARKVEDFYKCGDGVCTENESCKNCISDCGECPIFCGNAICDENEDCNSCTEDCGICETRETQKIQDEKTEQETPAHKEEGADKEDVRDISWDDFPIINNVWNFTKWIGASGWNGVKAIARVSSNALSDLTTWIRTFKR